MSDINEKEELQSLDDKIKKAHAQAGIMTEEEKQRAIAEKQKHMMKASASAGVEFAGAIIIATLFGIWLDKQVDSAPAFMLIFMLLGAITAFYNLYRASENLNSSLPNADSRLHNDQKNAKKTPD